MISKNRGFFTSLVFAGRLDRLDLDVPLVAVSHPILDHLLQSVQFDVSQC